MSSTVTSRDIPALETKSRSGRTRRAFALIALTTAVGAGAAWYGYDWWTVGRFTETTDDAYVGGNVTSISPHVAGFVIDIAVSDNQAVRAGQLLARLDRRDYQAIYDRDESVVAARQATLASLRAKYVLQQSTVAQASADVDAKIAHVMFTHQEAVRYADLAHASWGSRQEAERTSAADQESTAAVSSSRAMLAAARQQLNVIDTEIAEAGAMVAQAEADLRMARLNLDYTDIRSPIDGYVGNRAAQVGAYVSEGSYLFSVVPASGLWVDANFKEDQLARMRAGQAVSATADAVPGHVFRGQVVSVAPGTGAVFSIIPPENATGNFTRIVQRVPVRIAFDTDDQALALFRPGLSTTVSVSTRSVR